MALTYAILSVLADRLQHKDNIIKYFESSIGFFWKASRKQIDEEIAKLEYQGWIYSPDCQQYRLNPVGKQELIKWITVPCKPLSIRDDLLIKLLIHSSTNLAVIQQELIQHQQLHFEKLLVYHTIKEQNFPELQERSVVKVFPSLTLQSGILHEQEWVDWCDDSLSLVAILTAMTTKQILVCNRN
jgi:DNA-binding PadR family transcriptional regulator